MMPVFDEHGEYDVFLPLNVNGSLWMMPDDDMDNFYIRRVQRRQNGSLFISIPAMLVRKVGWKPGTIIRFYIHERMVIMAAIKADVTQKELRSAQKFMDTIDPSDIPDPSNSSVLEGKSREDGPDDEYKRSRLEKLRLK